jgi:regulator of nucleoside diphosphate kinase
MTEIRRDLSPAIVLSKADHTKLYELALAGLERMPEVAERLLNELDRARVVEDAKISAEVARMGSRVTYQTNSGQEHTVTLAYPADADIEQGKISVMTPVGAALIGLKTNQSITWHDRSGKRQMLTVKAVAAPVTAE